MKRILLLLTLVCTVWGCSPRDSRLPRAKQSEIQLDESMADRIFYDVYKHLCEELHSMMIVKDGKVIYEKYATGHSAEERHVMWSATKTFTATAVGFARQDGLLDLDDPILKYFRDDEIPQGHSPLLEKVTIRHLLTMSSGISDGNYNFEPDSTGKVNPVRACLSYPVTAEPGRRFAYNNNDTHLAAIIVSRVTGRKMSEYLDEKLFQPLGIRNYDWFEDPCGNTIGSYGLYLTTENLAKMSLFMLQKGVWNGKRLLEEEWFDMAMSEQIFQAGNPPDMTAEEVARRHKEDDWCAGYGFQMWMCREGRGCRLDGANGQFGIILPKENAVVVLTSKCWNTGMEMNSFWENVYPELMDKAVFTPLEYEAQAPSFDPATEYRNPILPGFHPDPSICRAGEDFYLVNSTFQYFPGLPVWHSTDLVHWEPCGAVLAKDDAISFTDQPMLFGLWAPQISYNPHNRKFYVVCTQVGGGIGNFFATCDDPREGRWDGPYRLPEVIGIDPSLFFEEDGRACIITAGSPEIAGSALRYPGESSILMWDFDWEKGTTTGAPHILARGGVHPEDHPASLEGGHIYKVDGRYFLMCAEGGTEAGHSEVVFSADRLEGPYTACAINPILTQRTLAPGRPDPVSCTGHADLVCTAGGDWYAVFLGCRPYEGEEYFNTGRETFLLPVHWRDGQPVILEAGEGVPTVVKKDKGLLELAAGNRIEGFDGFRPGPLWSADGLASFALSVRGDVRNRLQFEPDGRMRLTCSGIDLSDYGRPSAVFERITGTAFTASTTLSFVPKEGQEAGLVCWQDDAHYMKLTKRLDSLGRPVLRLEERGSAPRDKFEGFFLTRPEASVQYGCDLLLSEKEARSELVLRVTVDESGKVQFTYAPARNGQTPDPAQFRPVGEPRDGRHLSSRHCGGFQGAMVGVYAF